MEGADEAFRQMNRVYQVMQQIAAYPKPTISFMDGIAMGGGIGLGGHTRYRIVTDRSVVAMPETGIGLTPDAGGSWILSRAPGFSGLRLAVTGNRMNGVGAVMIGLLIGLCLPIVCLICWGCLKPDLRQRCSPLFPHCLS